MFETMQISLFPGSNGAMKAHSDLPMPRFQQVLGGLKNTFGTIKNDLIAW
jgi:hypothetical protein